jgi:hypothetical protein
MKLTFNNGVMWLLLTLVFTPLAFLFIPLTASLGVIVALVVLIVAWIRHGEQHHAGS